MPRHNKNVILTPLDMCRICLNDKQDVYIDVMGPNEPHLLQHVNEYFKVEITGNDGKSTKICQTCMEFIDIWQGHIEHARGCQLIVNYLAEKRYMSPISTSKTVSKRSSSVPYKKRKTSSRRSKKRKRSLSIPEYEIPSTSSSITSNDMIQLPLESIQQSTSAAILQYPSVETEYVTDFPSTSNSNETIPFVSNTNKIIPFPSTCTEIIPFTASTSTEVVPFASTSTEIVPFASTSTEIVPSYTINEISSTGENPVWYSLESQITDYDLQTEILASYKSFKVEYICIFCTYQYEEVSRNMLKHIVFCPKHSKPYACLKENCHSVFPNKAVFIPHYRTHLNLNNSAYLCHQCFCVLTCPRRSITIDHTHQNTSDILKCCSLTFTTMIKLVLHKLINHCAIVVINNNRSHTLKKQNLNIKKTELDDIKVSLDVPGSVPCQQIAKDNGSFKCYCCPIYFNNVLEFIYHTKIKHKNLITLKDKGIKLCPLCDQSYFNEEFSEHIEDCTNTLKVGDKSLNHYGCVHCFSIFTNVSSREFRNHVLYCKSFRLCIINNKLHHKCVNCTFTSSDDDLCLVHANSDCIYLQLKMRYAMGPDETVKVMRRMEFVKQYAEQQEDESCANNGDLSSSSTYCNTARQKILNVYNYFCNNCKNMFFDKTFFFKHMDETGSYCRLQTLIYCQKCLTEYKTLDDFHNHLPKMPEASPLPLSIKQEPFGPNNDNGDDLSMHVVRIKQNYGDVKVEEISSETFYQKQEPLNFDEISNMQYQEQEVSNIDSIDCFGCPEMEIQCEVEVEDKPDLNRLLLENVE